MGRQEAAHLRKQLIELIGPSFDDLDRLISVTNSAKRTANIWGTVDDREIELIADAWIGWGKASARGAVTVRALVANWTRYQVALILGPRMLETLGFYGEHGFALPLPAPRWRRPRGSAGAASAVAQRVPIVDATAAPPSAPRAPTPTPELRAPTPAPAPAPAVDPYRIAEEAQRAHAARVMSHTAALGAGAANGHYADYVDTVEAPSGAAVEEGGRS